MFDRLLLPEALSEFIVISDTHYLETGDPAIYEFQSRLGKDRVETALQLVASLEPPLVIHLGDLTMANSEREGFAQAITEALQQMECYGIEARQVAGNHEVGDKPDPTMPALPVRPESLAWYHAELGRSWYSFDQAGCHFIVLNAQLMNSTLLEAASQREWLENDLADHADERIFVFLHMPPYLWDEHEPALGHYEIIDEPARGWLLDLVRKYQVEVLAAGHTHFAFFDHIGPTRFFVLPSTSFTRGPFSYVFSRCPSDRGQNDAPKMGFYLFRVCQDRTDVHFIRTNGAVDGPNAVSDSPKRLVTRTSASLSNSPLGVTLRYPLAPSATLPIGRKSVIRRQVRNDYPLLACVELGVKWIRVPWTDLSDPVQSRRLAILRDEGVGTTATSLWSDAFDLTTALDRHLGQIDGWEVQIPGTLWPSADCLQTIQECRREQAPISLSAILPKQAVPGKSFRRTRVGYRPEELVELDRRLAERGTRIERVLCRIKAVNSPALDTSPWARVEAVRALLPLSHIGAVDCAVELQVDDQVNASHLAETFFAMALLPGSRLYLAPHWLVAPTTGSYQGWSVS